MAGNVQVGGDQIANWVYQQTERANSQVCLKEKELERLGAGWAQCLSA